MDVVYTDDGWIEQGYVKAYALDLSYGTGENDFELIVPIDFTTPKGALVYIDGTCWGGIILACSPSTLDYPPTNAITGLTWHGILAESYICPSGASHVEVSGDANDAMREIVRRQGLDAMFDVQQRPSGYRVSYRFDRFTDVYSGFRKMLSKVGARLDIRKDPGCKPTLSAVEAGRYVDDFDSGRFRYEMTDATPYNHIIGIGKGELEERAVVHRYADEDGNISDVQTIFFPRERQYLYELSGSEESELVEKCDEKLSDLQDAFACELKVDGDEHYEVGDLVGIVDEGTGTSITSYVEKVIVKIDKEGANVTNEIGDVALAIKNKR